MEGKAVKSAVNNFKVDINTSVNCQSKNIIYMVGCRKCPEQYIGQSERDLNTRFSEHKGYVVNNKISKATGEHFNQKGHKTSDMEVTVVEKVHNTDPQFRIEREKFYINKFNTRYKGINRSNGV